MIDLDKSVRVPTENPAYAAFVRPRAMIEAMLADIHMRALLEMGLLVDEAYTAQSVEVRPADVLIRVLEAYGRQACTTCGKALTVPIPDRLCADCRALAASGEQASAPVADDVIRPYRYEAECACGAIDTYWSAGGSDEQMIRDSIQQHVNATGHIIEVRVEGYITVVPASAASKEQA